MDSPRLAGERASEPLDQFFSCSLHLVHLWVGCAGNRGRSRDSAAAPARRGTAPAWPRGGSPETELDLNTTLGVPTPPPPTHKYAQTCRNTATHCTHAAAQHTEHLPPSRGRLGTMDSRGVVPALILNLWGLGDTGWGNQG